MPELELKITVKTNSPDRPFRTVIHGSNCGVNLVPYTAPHCKACSRLGDEQRVLERLLQVLCHLLQRRGSWKYVRVLAGVEYVLMLIHEDRHLVTGLC